MVIATGEPDPFRDGFTALIAARALCTACTLGVFDALREAPDSPAGLARRLALDPRGADALATALVAMGYLEREGERVRNAAVSERLLVSSAEGSIAHFVGAQGELHWRVLGLLPESVREGRAFALHEERWEEDELWEGYIRGLFEISRAEQDANAALVDVEHPHRLVDVAGGHGGFAMAMCRRHPALRAEVLDLPPSVAVGRRIVHEQGFADRVDFRAGDVFATGLGGPADVVSVLNLVHHLPERRGRELVRLARRALRPGGCLVLGDSARPEPGEDDDPRGAISSLLFHAWSHGRNFTPRELVGWLEDEGMADVTAHRNPDSPWRVVITGRIGSRG